ncbi:MAG: hypothetical protein R3F54_15305 [Alphaproteobacteria bacterium]
MKALAQKSLGSARGRQVFLVGLAVAAGLLLVAIANAHLVYVAVMSEPDCVPHFKASNEGAGSFRAAKSAC